MRPKGRGPAQTSAGEDKNVKRVAEKEKLQPHPERKNKIHVLPGKGGEDGLCCPGPRWTPSDPEKGDSGTSSEEGQQVDRRVGQGPSTPTFGICGPHWCLECGKNFDQKAELEKHQLNHAGKCSYICGDCGRNFLEHVALVAGQGACAARNPFSHVGCPRRVLPLASSEPVVIQRKERKELSLQEKVRVLEMLEGPKVSQSELAKRFGVSQPQICRIIKNKERILAEWCQNTNPGRKRKIEDKGPTIGDSSALLQWLQRSCASTNGALMQDVARRLSEGGAKPEWEPGVGWLSRIKAKQASGLEPPLAGKDKGEQVRDERWRNALLPDLLSKYEAPDIYSCGEVGLLFKATPEDLAWERRREEAQDRLTVLLCCNMDASDKRDPLVVGETLALLGGLPEPGGQESLPVSYRDSPKAWMTASVFTAWLQKFNREMQSKRRNVALCLAPCTAHPLTELSNIKMVFFPFSRPSRHHPLEQGITLNFKGHYRRRRLIRLLVGTDDHRAFHGTDHHSEPLSLLDATHIIVQAWLEVCPQTIRRSFQAAGFSRSPHFLASPPVDVLRALGFQNQEQFEEFVLVDEGLGCFGDQEGVQMVGKSPQASDLISTTVKVEEEEKMMEETEGSLLPPCPTQAEVRESLVKLRHYLECHSAPLATFQAFYKLEDVVHEMWLAGRQTWRAMALGKE